MNFKEAVTQIRLQLGFITNSKADLEWFMRKIIKENQEVFDALK